MPVHSLLRIVVATLVTACLGIAPPLFAADYYVSPSGSDSNNGQSIAKAWKTITAVVNHGAFSPGDRILFEGGATFAGNLYFSGDGTAALPIVVSSYGTGRATISAGSSYGVYTGNIGGYTFSNLNFVGSGTGTNTNYGLLFYNTLAGDVQKPHLYFDNLDVSGFGEHGLAIGGANGHSGYTDIRITNCAFHDNRKGGVITFSNTAFNAAAPAYAHSAIYVANCTAYNNHGDPTAGSSTGNGIMLGDVDGATIEYCTAHDNGINNFGAGGPVGLWTFQSTNVVIQYNESYRNRTSGGDGCGYDLDNYVTNSVLQYNYSHDNDGSGYLVYSDAGKPNSGNVIRYNISENDSRKTATGGVVIFGQISNCDIYNNTIFLTSATNAPAALRIISSTPTNIRAFNNLFVTRQGAAGSVKLVDAPAGSTYLFQGNNYFAESGTFAVKWGGTTYSSLSAWLNVATTQERIGGNVIALNVDPTLAQGGSGGTLGDAALLPTLDAYRLQSTSPLIDAGLNLVLTASNPGITSTGTRDFYGNSLPQGMAFDIGAHETKPTVSLSTINANASRVGPVNGTVAFSRTGSVSTTLSATGAILFSGSAVNGVDYLLLSSTLTIPAGSTSGTLSVRPVADGKIHGPQTATIQLATHPVYTTGTSATASVVIADSPLNTWRASLFPPAVWENAAIVGPNADPDGDGVPNLLEYALGGLPMAQDPGLSPAASLSGTRLQIGFRRLRTDLDYTVRGSGNLATWDLVATNPGSVGQDVTVADTGSGPRRFLKLEVSSNGNP